MTERAQRLAGLTYQNPAGVNLGDEIQSIAAEQWFEPVTTRVNRDTSATYDPAELTVVLYHGWLSHRPNDNFPVVSPRAELAITSVHIAPGVTRDAFSRPEIVEYLRTVAPIGCRDNSTKQFLDGIGVEAEYVGCWTATLPWRGDESPDLAVIVDAADLPLPPSLTEGALEITQRIGPEFGPEVRRAMASDLLSLYRQRAAVVVTTRLHAALPAAGMGVPVLFFGSDSDVRLDPLRELGITIHPLPPRAVRALCRFHAVRNLIGRFYYRRRPLRADAAPRQVVLAVRERITSFGTDAVDRAHKRLDQRQS